jgi:RNA recognition motif-containing protein
LLKAIGLYREPEPAKKRSSEPPASQAPKSNVRNARGPGREAKPRDKDSAGKRSSRGGNPATVESARVYVGNLSYDVTEQDLQELFKGIGGVRSVEIIYNRSTHRSKGYGFVEMLHRDEAVRAVEVLHDQPFMGRKLNVSGAKSKGEDERDERGGQATENERIVSLAPLPEASASTAVPAENASSPEPANESENEEASTR